MSDTAISAERTVRQLLFQAEIWDTAARIPTSCPEHVEAAKERAATYKMAAHLVEQWAKHDDFKMPAPNETKAR